MGRGRWALGGWVTGTYPPSPYQVREQVREEGNLPLPHHGMGQAGQGLSSQLPPRRRQRAAEKAGALTSSLPLPTTPTLQYGTKPSSPNPSILAPQPHPASFPRFRFKLNHLYQAQYQATSIAQRTASASAWDSLPPPSTTHPPIPPSRGLTGYLSLPSHPSQVQGTPSAPVFAFRTVSRHTPSVPPTRCLPIAQ